MTAVDTELDRLFESGGDPTFHRLKGHSGGEMAFRGREAVVGRMNPEATGVENEIQLCVTEREMLVIGLRVGHPRGGPNGPIQKSRYQVLRGFEGAGRALRWLDAACPWTEAVDDLKERLEQEHPPAVEPDLRSDHRCLEALRDHPGGGDRVRDGPVAERHRLRERAGTGRHTSRPPCSPA